MSHEFDTGFVVREPAWHGLATVLQDYPGTWEQAAVLAGLDWDPEERAVYEVEELFADGRANVKLIPGYKQIVQPKTGVVLQVANDSYTTTPNSVMGEIIEAILARGDDQPTPVFYETAGALNEGRRTWAMLRVGEQRELPGDPSPHQPYLALLNSHDGTAALRAVATNVRIVCANTWHAAEMQSARTGAVYTFRHTKNWRATLDAAKAALTATQAEIEQTFERARELLEVKVDAEIRRQYIKEFAVRRVIRNTIGKMPVTKRKQAIEDRLEQPKVRAAVEATVRDLNDILAGPTSDGIRDTMYGLVQAAGELLDHYRPANNAETHFTRTVMDIDGGKCDAYKIATELAPAA